MKKTEYKHRAKYAFIGNPSFRRTATDARPNVETNQFSWTKIDKHLKAHDEIGTLDELTEAVGFHPRTGGARKFVLYCADMKWLRVVVPA